MAVPLRRRPQASLIPEQIPEEVTQRDEEIFFRINATRLSREQARRLAEPERTYPSQREILAVHWHPEFIPLELIEERLERMFPNMQRSLVIPTQHNEFLTLAGYSGAEVDCYARGFNQKVQLLIHMRASELAGAHILQSMVEHTRQYRASQLFDFIRSITQPQEERLEWAARETGADEDLIRFVQIFVRKIQKLLDGSLDSLSPEMIKNKMLRNYFDELRRDYGDQIIDRAQTFLKAVKTAVKASFSLSFFYRTSEVIEEARKHSAGIVVPHPEQFWPILLADYDVDGYEVWNPQSQRYTEFLISAVQRKNDVLSPSKRELLVFMGDDTHMSEKVKPRSEQDREKGQREIGLQPAWEDLDIQKTLIKAGMSRAQVIEAYRARLDG
jgi:hypothetical protein